ncbi:MAG: SRPBCC family protein [Myxococcota bacterium]
MTERRAVVSSRRTMLAATGPVALGLALGPGNAWAKRPPGVRRYAYVQAGQKYKTGGAIIRVRAPLDRVLAEVLKYRRYHRVLPRIETSKIVRRDGKKSADVYMRAPIFGGMMSIWFIARFLGPKPWKWGGVQIEGTLVRSNVASFSGFWKLHPCGPKGQETVLRLELNLVPKVPVPTDMLERQFRWAAEKGVVAIRDLTEGKPSSVRDD